MNRSSTEGSVPVAIPVTGIWLRKIGMNAEVLFEWQGKWHKAIVEHIDGSFSHIIEIGGMADCKPEKK